MSTNVIQTSFASGEWAPSLTARVDLSKYGAAAALMRNFFVDYRSGASTRPGTLFVGQAMISTEPTRLIGFQFNSETSYAIEFGDEYCRFIHRGAYVLETAVNISNVTNAFPTAVTATGNTFSAGDWVFVSGVVGMPQINNRFYKVETAGSTFTLTDVNGNRINSIGYDAYVSGGTVAKVYTIVSPYAAEDLALLKVIQSASVMTLVHPDYPPYDLIAAAPTNWSFVQIVFGSSAAAPGGVSGTPTIAGSAYYAYVVTTVDDNGEESTPSNTAFVDAAVNLSTTVGSIAISWAAAANAQYYNIYKAEHSLFGQPPAGAAFGFVGTATGSSFVDSNIPPDFSATPPTANNPFLNNNPGTVCYFQQRLSFAGGTSFPTNFWMSQPGAFHNFNKSIPIKDDDAVEGTIVSLQVNEIKWLVPMPGGLIALTSKGAWQISGGGQQPSNNPVTATTAIATPQAYNGAADLPPIVVNFDLLYVQAKGSIVRDLSYNIYANIYTGTDISVLANHLFLGYQLTEWAYAEEPYKIIWSVRNDGHLLGLTFVKEQEITGWSHSDTLGLFKSVCSITEGQVDAVYVVVQRKIGGQWVQMIERFDDRQFTFCDINPEGDEQQLRANAESAWCVDCGVQSTLTTYEATLMADTNVGTVNFTTSVGIFDADDVDSVIRMGGGIATVDTFIGTNQVLGTWLVSPSKIIPNDPNKTPVPALAGEWTMTAPSTTFYGLDHLEGQTVSILADGSVITPQVVANGSITLDNPASLVTVGLAYQCQLQTMDLEVETGADTIQGKRKKLSAVTVRMANARGLKYGHRFDDLTQIKELTPTVQLNRPIPLITGDSRVNFTPLWAVPGRICLQQDDPLPATVLGLIPEITLGDTK